MMKKIIIFLCMCLLCGWGSAGAKEVALTLDEAVALALGSNRDVLLKTEDITRAKAKIAQAKAALFPSLSFSGSWLDSLGLYSKNFGQTSAQFSARQTLFKSGIINTISYNEYGTAIAQALLDKTKLDTILNTRKAFYTLLLAEQFVQINKGLVANAKSHLTALEARYRQGLISESDIITMRESLATVQQASEASQNQVETATALLKNLLYLDDSATIQLSGEFRYDPKEFAFEDAFIKAMQLRPEIKQLDAQGMYAGKAVEIAKSDTRPTITASWDYYSRSHLGAGAAGTSAKNWNDYQTVGFAFSWPIFDGWAAKSKVDQALVDVKQTKLLQEKMVKDIALEVKHAYVSLKNSIAGVRTAEAEIATFSDRLAAAKEQYGAGIASALDVDDTEIAHTVSIFNRAQAIYDYLIAQFNFDRSTGGI